MNVIDGRQRQLLYDVDLHQVHLACIKLMDSVGKDVDYPVMYDAGDKRLPPVLSNLQHGRVRATHDSVQVEFGGGFFHYGYYASRNYTTYTLALPGPSRLLLPDLWYYAEAGRFPD